MAFGWIRSSEGQRGHRISGESRAPRRRQVAARVLLTYVVVTAAFAIEASWGVLALRNAGREADLIRRGYLPLTRALRDLVTLQDTWNAQLNHVTSARNPADTRLWFDTAIRIGRPKKFSEVRAALARAFLATHEGANVAFGNELNAEIHFVERFVEHDGEQLHQLFNGLETGQPALAERLRDSLVRRGLNVHTRLARIDQRVLASVDAMGESETIRERFAIGLLIALSILTVIVGVVMALLTRQMLAPLAHVTERARAVAKGDFTPKAAVDTRDEIGELASTFESMVAAISEARERLLTSERLATIGKMAAHVTHEIRNPLSSISLNLELLQDEMPSQSPETQALMKAIQAEIDRLTQLTEYYLSFPRSGTFKPELVDVRSLVADAISFMGRDLERRSIQTEVILADAPLLVSIDEAQLRQALFNLVRNSAEAMPEGGKLKVVVSDSTPARATIEINDQGKGIAPELAARLFQPFVTNKPNGTGLGLVATQQIVQSHDGTIGWEPLQPQGTRFILQFPIATLPQD
jgi:two-component system, NtrC family, sensor kinase